MYPIYIFTKSLTTKYYEQYIPKIYPTNKIILILNNISLISLHAIFFSNKEQLSVDNKGSLYKHVYLDKPSLKIVVRMVRAAPSLVASSTNNYRNILKSYINAFGRIYFSVSIYSPGTYYISIKIL